MDNMAPDVLADRQPAAATPSMTLDVLTNRLICLESRMKLLEDRVHGVHWRSVIITIITAAITAAGTGAVVLG